MVNMQFLVNKIKYKLLLFILIIASSCMHEDNFIRKEFGKQVIEYQIDNNGFFDNKMVFSGEKSITLIWKKGIVKHAILPKSEKFYSFISNRFGTYLVFEDDTVKSPFKYKDSTNLFFFENVKFSLDLSTPNDTSKLDVRNIVPGTIQSGVIGANKLLGRPSDYTSNFSYVENIDSIYVGLAFSLPDTVLLKRKAFKTVSSQNQEPTD